MSLMKPTCSQDASARNYLERSRQSARECRVRKTIRFQYLELLVERREKDVVALKEEMENLEKACVEIDASPDDDIINILEKWNINVSTYLPSP